LYHSVDSHFEVLATNLTLAIVVVFMLIVFIHKRLIDWGSDINVQPDIRLVISKTFFSASRSDRYLCWCYVYVTRVAFGDGSANCISNHQRWSRSGRPTNAYCMQRSSRGVIENNTFRRPR